MYLSIKHLFTSHKKSVIDFRIINRFHSIMDTQECYVCNQLAIIKQQKSIHVPSKYSKTPISEFIRRLLDATKPTRFSENDTVCEKCLKKFDEYDLACVTVKRVEAELKQTLTSTEQIYLKQEVVEFLELDDEQGGHAEGVSAQWDTDRHDEEVFATQANVRDDFKKYEN